MHKSTHPGKVLRDKIEAMGMNAAELARLILVPANRISQIMAGKRNLSADTALRLGKLFATGPEFWLNLQTTYDLAIASHTCAQELAAIEVLGSKSELAALDVDVKARSNWGHVSL